MATFCVIGSDYIGLIDVKDHNEPDLFSNPDLINTVANSWPELLERFRVNGIHPPAQGHSPGDISSLRKGGISTFITIKNQVYIAPGMGVTSASTPLRVSLSMDRVRKYISELAKIVFEDESQFKTESRAAGVNEPIYDLAITAQGLVVHEKNENKAFIFPRGTGTFLAELHEILAPKWAIDFLASKSPS